MGCCKSIPSIGNPHTHHGLLQQESDIEIRRTIYVENLPANIPVSLLRKQFRKFGKITIGKIQVINLGSNAYAFIQFEAIDSAAEAVKASPHLMCGRRVFTEEVRWSSDRGHSQGNTGDGLQPSSTQSVRY